jgi:excisionase family DNA binding protein
MQARLPERFLTAQEIAERYHVSVRFVYALAESGDLPCVRLGRGKRRLLRFREEDIQALIESSGR